MKIELFKTKCKLPDGNIGEICKELVNNNYLVCNSKGWWKCSQEWIKRNKK